jgi:hypothetical protein
MAKHKITINNPRQTHYTVEGVQAYSPEEIAAMREREERTMASKDGIYAPVTVVLLSYKLGEPEETGKSR